MIPRMANTKRVIVTYHAEVVGWLVVYIESFYLDLSLLNILQGLTNYKIGVTCVYNRHVLYTQFSRP